MLVSAFALRDRTHLQSIHYPADTIFNNALAEVYDHAELEACQSQVCQDLSFENAVVRCDRFAFDDDLAANDQIDSKRRSKYLPLIWNGKPNLATYRQTSSLQFPYQGLFVDAFEEARASQCAMDFDGALNDVSADLIFI
jgi:hypothetical protein